MRSSYAVRTTIGHGPFTLSVLSAGGTGVGMTAEDGLAGTILLARTADQRGYHRFWMSEHHAIGATSVSSPPLMAARLIAETTRIRLRAGGVMLPNHSPLLIAEQFGMLEAFAPGRIDLGLGRAPGTDGATAAGAFDLTTHCPAWRRRFRQPRSSAHPNTRSQRSQCPPIRRTP